MDGWFIQAARSGVAHTICKIKRKEIDMIKKQKKATRILNCLIDWDIKHVSKDASGKMIIKGFANTADRDRVGDVVLPSAFEKSLPELKRAGSWVYSAVIAVVSAAAVFVAKLLGVM